jgi:hypothetical protein
MAELILVDAHVHFHSCFDWNAFLNAASRNFQIAGLRAKLPCATAGCLFLTERAGVNYFASLRDAGLPYPDATHWRVVESRECSLILQNSDANTIIIVVGGRQIETAEKLEVLAIGLTDSSMEGAPVPDVIHSVRAAGAIPVLPWGFGKWVGSRGKIIRRLLDTMPPRSFCLGDNGGRIGFLPRPKLLGLGEERGFLVLPGSDPLPLSSQVDGAGSYGFMLPITNKSIGLELIQEELGAMERSPVSFGSPSSITRAVWSQVSVRLCGKRSGAQNSFIKRPQ